MGGSRGSRGARGLAGLEKAGSVRFRSVLMFGMRANLRRLVGASLLVMGCASLHAQQPETRQAADEVGPVSTLPRREVPVQLDALHLVAKDGIWLVEGTITSLADVPLVRIETTVLITADGRHPDRQVDELPADLLPISPHATRSFALPMRTAVDGNQLHVGVSAAESATEIWTNDRLEDDAETPAAPLGSRSPCTWLSRASCRNRRL